VSESPVTNMIDGYFVPAFTFNLFAQDMFTHWVQTIMATIRSTGSKQLVDVGQDEGGVTDRLLNQFYGAGGLSFTTNHTYWRDDSLLWDSIVAKRPGIPNIVGETGYQPVWSPNGTWRYDEITGYTLLEEKWALGFAAGNSGALQWDWAREVDFGMKRSNGSAKSWEPMMRDIGQFAEKAAPLQLPLCHRKLPLCFLSRCSFPFSTPRRLRHSRLPFARFTNMPAGRPTRWANTRSIFSAIPS
jgi:hypothetical protein